MSAPRETPKFAARRWIAAAGYAAQPPSSVAHARSRSSSAVSAVISRIWWSSRPSLNCVKTQHLPSARAVVTTAKPLETAPSSERPPA